MTRPSIARDLGLTSAEHWKTVAKVALFLVVSVPAFLVLGAAVAIHGGIEVGTP